MTRRAIWRALLIPQAITAVLVAGIIWGFATTQAAKAALIGGAIVMLGSFVAGFIGMGPSFNRVGIAFTRVMLAEGIKIFVMFFLLVLYGTQTTLPTWALCLGFGVTYLGSLFSLKLLR